MENAEPLARVGLKTLKCILCHQVTTLHLALMPQMVLMSELPPTQYISHLSKLTILTMLTNITMLQCLPMRSSLTWTF